MKKIVSYLLVICGALLIIISVQEFMIAEAPITQPIPQHLQPTPTPTKQQTTLILSAWIQTSQEALALERLQQSTVPLQTIHPIWYRLSRVGTLDILSSEQKQDIIQTSKENNLDIIPSVRNESDRQGTALLLTSVEKQEQFITNLVNEALKYEYLGYDIFFENVDPEYGEDFTSFIARLQKAFVPNNLFLSITVPPRTGKTNETNDAKTYDWKSLLALVDVIRIKAFDYHNPASNPGPQTPRSWYIDVLTYAQTVIPQDKLAVSLAGTGYIWDETRGTATTYQQGQELAEQYAAPLLRDPQTQALTATYTNRQIPYTLWLEDSVSMYTKIETAKRFGITQFTIWHLGGEDLRIWQLLANNQE